MKSSPNNPIFKIIPYAVLIALLIMSIQAYRFVDNAIQKGHQSQFDIQVRDMYDLIYMRFLDCKQILEGSRGLFSASKSVERDEWKSYVAALNIKINYPGILGVGFGKKVTPENKQTTIDFVHTEGFPDFNITPVGDRSIYVPVFYIEPMAGVNLNAFGYDMYEEEVRRHAMDEAVNKNSPIMTGKVLLKQDSVNVVDPKPGVYLYLPVFTNGANVGTLDERKEHLEGFVYLPIRVYDLINAVFGANYPLMRVQIFDDPEQLPEHLIYDNLPSLKYAEYHVVKPLALFDRQMLVVFSYPGYPKNYLSVIVLMGGILISLLFSWMLQMARVLNSKAERLANQKTVDLARSHAQMEKYVHEIKDKENELLESKINLQSIIDNVPDALLTMDQEGCVLDANPAALTMFDKTFDQLRGANIQDVNPHLSIQSIVQELNANGRDSRMIDRQLISFKKSTGVMMDIEFSASVFIADGQKKIVLFLRDVTQLKRVQDMERQRVNTFERMNKLMVDREMRMMELKQQIQTLKAQLNSAKQDV